MLRLPHTVRCKQVILMFLCVLLCAPRELSHLSRIIYGRKLMKILVFFIMIPNALIMRWLLSKKRTIKIKKTLFWCLFCQNVKNTWYFSSPIIPVMSVQILTSGNPTRGELTGGCHFVCDCALDASESARQTATLFATITSQLNIPSINTRPRTLTLPAMVHPQSWRISKIF